MISSGFFFGTKGNVTQKKFDNNGYTTVMGYLNHEQKRYERRPPFTYTEQDRPQIIVFSGFNSIMKNIQGIYKEITTIPADGIVWNSLLSFDRPEPDRYMEMAHQILRSLNAHRETHLIAHSFGSAELIRALMECRHFDPTFFSRDLSPLHITLVSPSGMFAGIDGLMKFMQNDVPALLESITPNSPYHVVDALICFPPQGMAQSDVSIMLQNIYPSHAQVNLQKIQPEFSQLPELHDYTPYLTPSDARTLTDIDKKLSRTFHTMKKEVLRYSGVESMLKDRTQLLHPYLERIYSGDCYKDPDSPKNEEPFNPGLFALAIIHFLPALKEKLIGRFPDMLKTLRSQGASLQILIPTHDAFVPFERVAKLFPNEEITFIPGTHMTFPTQPQSVLLTALREHGEKR